MTNKISEEALQRFALYLELVGYSKEGKATRALLLTGVDSTGTPILEYGDFGGNCRQLGVYSYRGFDIVVTGADSEAPIIGGVYTVGIYNEGEVETDALFDSFDFNFIKVTQEINSYIDMISESKKVTKVCTCGAKHTSNPNFHMSWCDKE